LTIFHIYLVALCTFHTLSPTHLPTLSLHDALPILAPHHVEQVFPGVHPAGVAHEQLHQVELLGGELHALPVLPGGPRVRVQGDVDRKSTRLNSSHVSISYAVFCLKKKKKKQ